MSDAGSSSATRQAATLGSRLQSARSRRFAGREAELKLFERALDDRESEFAVLFVHGPPGVGKSALLREFEARATARGRAVTRLDLRQVEATPQGLMSGLGAPTATTPGASTAEFEALRDIDVLMLDTYELAAPLDGWIREQLVPSLPAESVVVIAGRLAPSPEWTADPGWKPLIRVVGLRNLRRDDASRLLAAEGIDPERHGRIIDETFGHPLALCLYADLLVQRDERAAAVDAPGLLYAPDVVRSLLDRFVDEVPSAAHRGALELCAHVRFTTEALIRVGIDLGAASEAAALFDWLRGLSFVDAAPEGLFPHDLARDVLDTDLRWRDAAAYDTLHMRVRRHLVGRVRSTSGPERRRTATDLVFLHRSNPLMHRFFDFSGLGQGYLDRLRPEDHEPLRAMVEQHEGPASVAVLTHWIERQPEGFAIVRVGAEPSPRGFTMLLALHDATTDDLAKDPGARAMWAYAQRQGAPAPGEAVIACRYIIDRDAHQAPGSLTLGLAAINHLQDILTRDPRAMDLIGGTAFPDQLAPLFSYIDFLRVPVADYELDCRQWAVFAHDWRRQSVDPWFQMIAERELGAPVEPESIESSAPTIALSQPDFAEAVRAALRDLHRPERLRQNPLLRSRLVRDLSSADTPAALVRVVSEAVDGLAHDPRTEKFQRALDRTYLRPAPSQERAAEMLGLPFSTYRRHLNRGVECVVGVLWDRELYGPADPQIEQKVSSERSGV